MDTYTRRAIFPKMYFSDHEAFGFIQDKRFVHFCKFYNCSCPNRSIIQYEGKKWQRGLKWTPRTDTDSSLWCAFFYKLQFSIFPLERVEPSKLFNNMKLLILILDLDEKALIILQVQIMKMEWKLYLENEEKFFSGIPSIYIEKKITDRIRKFLSFTLFDLFWYTLYIKRPLTCIQVNLFLTQKNGKHFIDISIVSKGEDFL